MRECGVELQCDVTTPYHTTNGTGSSQSTCLW